MRVKSEVGSDDIVVYRDLLRWTLLDQCVARKASETEFVEYDEIELVQSNAALAADFCDIFSRTSQAVSQSLTILTPQRRISSHSCNVTHKRILFAKHGNQTQTNLGLIYY